jgi:hypothetical protein
MLHVVEEAARSGQLASYFSLDELESRADLFSRAAAMVGGDEVTPEGLAEHLRSIHRELIAPLTGVTTVGMCAERCIDILLFIANRSTSRQHLFFRVYVDALLATLARISQSLIAGRTFEDPETIFRIVRRVLANERVPLPGTPIRGLQVLGLLETRNLKFDRVYVLGAVDELIPGHDGEATLIPAMIRRELGLPTRSDHDRIAAYHFDLLISGAREVFFFFSEHETEGASRFVEKRLWETERVAGGRIRDNLVRQIPYRITLSHSVPKPLAKTPALVAGLKAFRFSATALDTYLGCGLRFYYHHVLRLEEREESAGDIDPAGLGRFVHDVLARFYAPFLGKTIDGSELDHGFLTKTVDILFRERFGAEELGNQYLMKIRVKSQLDQFLSEYEIPRLSEWPVELVGLEQEINVRWQDFDLRGRIDRIERTGNTVYVRDFKTGGDGNRLRIHPGKIDRGDRSTWSGAIGSLQLPLYALLYRELARPEHPAILPSYILLGRNRLGRDAELPLYEKGGSHEDLSGLLEHVTLSLLREITDVAVPFSPAEELDKECPNCPFNSICGTAWIKKRPW